MATTSRTSMRRMVSEVGTSMKTRLVRSSMSAASSSLVSNQAISQRPASARSAKLRVGS